MKAVAAILLFMIASLAGVGQAEDAADGQIVFVCEHGSVKSLMASVLFNRAAEERGLPWRSVSRGLQPDARVPEKIAAALRQDGFEVGGYLPKPLSEKDVAAAARLVTIGVDPPANAERADSRRRWDDVPPASVDYAAARSALERHIDELLEELAKP